LYWPTVFGGWEGCLYAKKEHKNLKGYGAENGVQNVFFGGVFTSMDKEGTVNVAFFAEWPTCC